MRKKISLLTLLASLLALTVVLPASASFPGANGKLAFVKVNPALGTNDIWVMNADGSSPTQLTTDPANDRWPSWSPDGTKIAFVGCVNPFTTPDCEIYKMNPDGSGETQVTSFGVTGGTGSVDWQPIPTG